MTEEGEIAEKIAGVMEEICVSLIIVLFDIACEHCR